MAVAEAPGDLYNPLLLYGRGRCGKTHLLHVMAHHVERAFPKRRVLYVRAGDIPGDPAALSDWDVLLLDDCHLLGEHGLEWLRARGLCGAVSAAGPQLVLATQLPPREMPELEHWVRSCEWGLVCGIEDENPSGRLL